ncbi:MAG: ABC transporter permease [Christensenellales bacterium]|jgi:putative ABC transport system permease protein
MIVQAIKMAGKAIASNKMRSFLTMLGIIIGIVALVVMISLVGGATSSVTGEIESLGSNLISVQVLDNKGNPMYLPDVAVLTQLDEIALAAPVGTSSGTAKYAYTEKSVSVNGTTAVYKDIQALELEGGRFIRTTDVENGSYVAVLAQDTARELFGATDILGELFTIDGRQFMVVGVLAEDTSMMSAFMSSLNVYVPYSVESRISGKNEVTAFYVSGSDAQDLSGTEKAIRQYMNKRLRQDEDAYLLMNQSTLLDAVSSVTDMMTLLLGGIAAISLLVGGIGIMNIMLVSVTERTKEIGIRKAIGAGRGSIMLQFLIEALMVSLIGCAIGLALSWAILEVIGLIAGELMSFQMTAGVVGMAVSFSVAIGVIFGLYPANKASSKHPIEALRYEG